MIRRAGADVVLLGKHKLIEEVRAQTHDSAQSVHVFLKDFHAEYTYGQVIGESNLQNRVVQQELTPRLGELISVMKDELDIALEKEFATCDSDGWTEVDATSIFGRIAARVISRLWLGPAGRDNKEWVTITDDYTKNVFITGFTLRFVPSIFRPLVARLLPSYRGIVRRVADARRVIGGLAADRTPREQTVHNDVLQWTMNLADADAGELKIDNLAQRILILSLSGIHTTALTMAQAFFDMVSHSDHISIIRKEVVEVIGSKGTWDRDGLSKLVKMDSLLKESQRLNPVFLITFNRFLPNSVTLSNGVHLPAGTRIGVPQHAIGMDPDNIPGGNPDVFDPWRYSRLQENPGNTRRYHFAQTDSAHMAFGHGKYACFGRFLAANEIKMVLAHLVLMFDIKLPGGGTRPQNFTVDGDMYPDPGARVLMRRRKVEEDLKHLLISAI